MFLREDSRNARRRSGTEVRTVRLQNRAVTNAIISLIVPDCDGHCAMHKTRFCGMIVMDVPIATVNDARRNSRLQATARRVGARRCNTHNRYAFAVDR